MSAYTSYTSPMKISKDTPKFSSKNFKTSKLHTVLEEAKKYSQRDKK